LGPMTSTIAITPPRTRRSILMLPSNIDLNFSNCRLPRGFTTKIPYIIQHTWDNNLDVRKFLNFLMEADTAPQDLRILPIYKFFLSSIQTTLQQRRKQTIVGDVRIKNSFTIHVTNSSVYRSSFIPFLYM
jgi:hypothetical protein